MILPDTSVWIEYFRRRESPTQVELRHLLEQGQVIVAGVVLTELLRGARSASEFEFLARTLSLLPQADVSEDTWVRCGEVSYHLMRQGITVGLGDALIAAIAIDGGHDVYALDSDFRHIPNLRLHQPAGS